MKLEQLTDQIYEKGVAKARQEEERIQREAQKEADRIIAEANKKASDIVEKAEKDAAARKSRLEAELTSSGEKAVSALKERITEHVLGQALARPVKDALNEREFIQKLILRVVERWNAAEPGMDLALILSTEEKSELKRFVEQQVKQTAGNGMVVKTNTSLKDGFRIEPADGSFRITFSSDDFVRFFRPMVRDYTRRILFDNASGEEKT